MSTARNGFKIRIVHCLFECTFVYHSKRTLRLRSTSLDVRELKMVVVRASATLGALNSPNTIGTIQFTQEEFQGPTTVAGTLENLPPSKTLAISIRVFGDLRDGAALGPHFNPFGKNHGAPTDAERHVGSLGTLRDVVLRFRAFLSLEFGNQATLRRTRLASASSTLRTRWWP